MRGDFSRLVLEPDIYSRVLMQQGRVLLDSDWNTAQAALIAAHRTLAADLIGPHGGPSGGNLLLGFSIVDSPDGTDLAIGPGIYYVDGIRIENPGDPATGDRVLWSTQPFPPFMEKQALPEPPYLVYLDVWERHVTTLQDDTLREVALGGPDTTSRAQVVWQVRVDTYPDIDEPTCKNFPLKKWRDLLAGNPPYLRARATPLNGDDPCLATPDARYRGVENQLYRVEIADVTDDGASFVWSRENGSVAVPWIATDGNDLHVTGVRDTVHGFAARDWIELTWDTLELGNRFGTRAQISDTDGLVITIDPGTVSGEIESHPVSKPGARVRRWDQRDGMTALVDGAIPVTESDDRNSDWVVLEDGIDVQFALPVNALMPHTYHVGDYWTIPARVATGEIIWPQDADGTRVAIPPAGVVHHYAPLAWQPEGGGPLVDLRRQFAPLAQCI